MINFNIANILYVIDVGIFLIYTSLMVSLISLVVFMVASFGIIIFKNMYIAIKIFLSTNKV